MNGKRIKIPAGLAFEDLRLAMDPRTNQVKYRPEILAPLFQANNLHLQKLFDIEHAAGWVIGEWYLVHLAKGGNPHPMAERLLHHRHRR